MSHRLVLICFVVAVAALWSISGRPWHAGSATALERANQYLSDNAPAYGLQRGLTDLRLVGHRKGLSAEHAYYQQTVRGIPVLGAYVSVSVPDKAGVQPLVFSNYRRGVQGRTPTSVVGQQALLEHVSKAIAPGGEAREIEPATLIYFPADGETLVPAWQLIVRTREPFGEWLVVADVTTGEILHRQSLLQFDGGQVFDPNPGQTNGGTPAAPDCDTSFHEGQLDDQYVTRTLQGINPGQDRLKGPWVDLTAPGIDTDFNFDGQPGDYKPAGQANEPSRDYIYDCNDDRFEEVMAYYHLDAAQRKIQSLGFTGESSIMARPIPVHAHFTTDCQAFFDPADRGLHFGDFEENFFFPFCDGVPSADAAEDADVIVHEYGHAIQDDQVPAWGRGSMDEIEQPLAMGEGFGDFFAAVINGDPCIGEYLSFGLQECGGQPGLRWADNARVYPSGFDSCPDVDLDFDGQGDIEEPHCGGLVWSGTLWDLAENLSDGVASATASVAGRDLALQLVLDAQFYLSPVPTFAQAAAAICMADEILYAGAHSQIIGSTFANRGFSSGSCTHTDDPFLYLRILHPYSGDLAVNVLVGSDTGSPVCDFIVGEPNPFLFVPNLYVISGMLDSESCADFLPPTQSQPWWLEVRDDVEGDVGTIEGFQILLAGGERCLATDTPIAIPDNGPAVYSRVDCSHRAGPLGPQTSPTPTPTATPTGSATPTATPTPTPAGVTREWGDIDCAGSPNIGDAQKIARSLIGLPVSQSGECPHIGDQVTVDSVARRWADVDCGGAVNIGDAQKLARTLIGLAITQTEPCPNVGDEVSVTA